MFDGAGQWVSFTYEDHVLASLRDAVGERRRRSHGTSGDCGASYRRTGNARPENASFGETRQLGADLNQRNIAIAVPGRPVTVPHTHPRNHDGDFFCAVVTTTVNEPRPGSDEISRAYEEAWIGRDGYVRADGSRQAPCAGLFR